LNPIFPLLQLLVGALNFINQLNIAPTPHQSIRQLAETNDEQETNSTTAAATKFFSSTTKKFTYLVLYKLPNLLVGGGRGRKKNYSLKKSSDRS
jgi:hypothetical protein